MKELRLILLAICALVVLALVACGGGPTPEASEGRGNEDLAEESGAALRDEGAGESPGAEDEIDTTGIGVAPEPVPSSAPSELPEQLPGHVPDVATEPSPDPAPNPPEPGPAGLYVPDAAATPDPSPAGEEDDPPPEVHTASAAAAGDGKAVFLAQRCEMCHSVSSAGIAAKTKAGGDLTGVVAKIGRERAAQVIRAEAAGSTGKKHPKKFAGTDAELAALLDWLATQS